MRRSRSQRIPIGRLSLLRVQHRGQSERAESIERLGEKFAPVEWVKSRELRSRGGHRERFLQDT